MANLITVTNCETNETMEREMTADEIAQFNAIKADKAQQAQKQAQIEADKAALSAKLGISADEAKLLLG